MPLNVSDGMKAWISDFTKSDAPQFKGKSEEERRKMAIAAYMAAKKESKNEGTHGPEGEGPAYKDFEADFAKKKVKMTKHVAKDTQDAKLGEAKLDERQDTAMQVAKALKKMGVKSNAKEAEILKKIPDVLKKMGLGNNRMIKRDPDFQGDIIDSLRSMKESIEENFQVQKYDAKGKKDGPPKSFGGNLKKATDYASKMGSDYRVHKEAAYGTQAQRLMSPLQKARQDKEKADRDRDGKLKSTALPRKVKLKGFGPDHAKGNMGNPSARAALKPKTEQYMHEGIDTDKLMEGNGIPFAGPYKKAGEPRKDRFGNTIKPSNVARHLARSAAQKLADKQKKKPIQAQKSCSEEVDLEESPMVTFTVPNVDFAMASKLERIAKEKKIEYSRKGRTVVLKGKRIDITMLRTKMGLAQTNIPMVPVKEEVELDEAAGGMFFKVSVSGLPDIVMIGRSPGDVKSQLRKIVKQPSMITDVERMTRAEVKKRYRDLALGDMEDDDLQTSESTQAYAKSVQAIADKKKKDAMSSSDKDKLGKLAAMLSKEKRK